MLRGELGMSLSDSSSNPDVVLQSHTVALAVALADMIRYGDLEPSDLETESLMTVL